MYSAESSEIMQQQQSQFSESSLQEGPKLAKTAKKGATLATLDRRPNRPPFHHMGPLPASRRGGPYVNYQPQQNIGKRMGVLANMQDMITLAKNEIGVLRDLAKNITDSGKELNLWEVLAAVNSTVADNPNSGIGKLMKRYVNIKSIEFIASKLIRQTTQCTQMPMIFSKLENLLF